MGPNTTKLGTKHPWGKGIQFCPNEGSSPSKGKTQGNIPNTLMKLENLIPQNHVANFNQT